MKKIYLSPPYMGGGEMKYIREAFETNWIAPLGPNVTGFEKEAGEYLGVPYPLALSSGTAAIHLSLKYLGAGSGDIVFCSSFTFSGSCNAAAYEKSELVFIDSEPETWNMSPVALQKAFDDAEKNGKLPKAVIVVDLYGCSADWDKIIPICKRYNVPIIEDSAEAFGSKYKGSFCGVFGDIGIMSFNGNKIITTSGGGMALCKTKEEYDKMLFWATQSREPTPHYEHKEIGYNYRLSNICAGIGRGQLEIIDEKLKRRKDIYERYREGFLNTKIHVMPEVEGYTMNHWLTVTTLDESAEATPEFICAEMNKLNVETRPAWKPMHLQPVFSGCKAFAHGDDGSFVCEEIYRRGICLPSGDALTKEQQSFITDSILKLIGD